METKLIFLDEFYRHLKKIL